MMDDRAMESRVGSEENACTNERRGVTGDGPKSVQRSIVSRTKMLEVKTPSKLT